MRFLLVICFALLCGQSMAQRQAQTNLAKDQKQVQLTMSKEEMIAKRKEIQDAINETEGQLERLKNDKKATMGELKALQDKLSQRQRLIENINDEMSDIDNTIKSSSTEVVSLRQRLDQLKTRYAQSIRYAYETRSSYDMLAFLFSSHDFNDAMRRMKYLKKFREFRKMQVDQIRNTQDQLKHKIDVLSTQKKQKDELLTTQEQQKQVLLKETNETNQVMQQLKGRESELMKSIEKNRQTAKRVDHFINMVIERELAKAAREAEEKRKAEDAAAKKKESEGIKVSSNAADKSKNSGAQTSAENTYAAVRPRASRPEPTLLATPTDIALENNFQANKGKLYWPVDKGYITDHFGVHPHPIETKVMINNNGVDIQTTPDAAVRAVFEGTVKSVSTIENMMVMIQVGDYYMVYNNLKSVSVKKDDHVSTHQVIGVVAPNDNGDPTINFQIWKVGKRTEKLDPEQWLGKLH